MAADPILAAYDLMKMHMLYLPCHAHREYICNLLAGAPDAIRPPLSERHYIPSQWIWTTPVNSLLSFEGDGYREAAHIVEYLNAVHDAETQRCRLPVPLDTATTSSRHDAQTPEIRTSVDDSSSGAHDSGTRKTARFELNFMGYKSLRHAITILCERTPEALPIPSPSFEEFVESFCRHMGYFEENGFTGKYAIESTCYFLCIPREAGTRRVRQLLDCGIIRAFTGSPSSAPLSENSRYVVSSRSSFRLNHMECADSFMQRFVSITTQFSEVEDVPGVYFFSHPLRAFPVSPREVEKSIMGVSLACLMLCQMWADSRGVASDECGIVRYSNVTFAVFQLTTNNFPMNVKFENPNGEQVDELIPPARLTVTIGVPPFFSDVAVKRNVERIMRMIEFVHGPRDLLAVQCGDGNDFRQLVRTVGALVMLLVSVYFWERPALPTRAVAAIADFSRASTQRFSPLTCSIAHKIYLTVGLSCKPLRVTLKKPMEQEIIACCMLFQDDVILSDANPELTALLSSWAALPQVKSSEREATNSTAAFRGGSAWQSVRASVGGQFALVHYGLFDKSAEEGDTCFRHSPADDLTANYFASLNPSKSSSSPNGLFIVVDRVFLSAKICGRLDEQLRARGSRGSNPRALSEGWYFAIRFGAHRINVILVLRVELEADPTTEPQVSRSVFRRDSMGEAKMRIYHEALSSHWEAVADANVLSFTQLDASLVSDDRPAAGGPAKLPRGGSDPGSPLKSAPLTTHCLVHNEASGSGSFLGDTVGISTKKDPASTLTPSTQFALNQFIYQSTTAQSLLAPFIPERHSCDGWGDERIPMATAVATRAILRQKLLPQRDGHREIERETSRVPAIAAHKVGSQSVFFTTSEINGSRLSMAEDKLNDFLRQCPLEHAFL